MARKTSRRARKEGKTPRQPSDLNDRKWGLVEPLLPEPHARGRPRRVSLRKVVDAVLYISHTGCQWRQLPAHYPCWQTCYGYFREFLEQGVWKKVHDTLRARVRRGAGRQERPTAGIIDSQSVKSIAVPGQRGYDAGKKVNGIKRHVLVDTNGLMMALMLTAADVQDRDGAKRLLSSRLDWACQMIKLIWVDGAYRGRLIEWVWQSLGITLQPVLRCAHIKGFQLLPRRWVVERTFGWLSWSRRLGRHHEGLPECGEAFIHIAMIRIMLNRRLA